MNKKLSTWFVKGGAYDMNKRLRAGQRVSGDAAAVLSEIEKCEPLAEEIRIWRGIDFFGAEIPDIERGVLVASGTESVAGQFTTGRKLLALDIQPGVRALHIGGYQDEWLIEPGVKLTETFRCKIHDWRGELDYIVFTVTK